MLRDQLAILFRALLPLLELPLPFEERRLVDESKDIVERNIFNNARAIEGRARNRRIRVHVRARGVRRVT